MHFTDGLWAIVTTIINIVTLSPTSTHPIDQVPLHVSLPETSTPSLEVIPIKEADVGPIFQPPGSSNPNFVCNYSSMTDWEYCSTPLDRHCWLRSKIDGHQLDVFTDYEHIKPNGTTRVYNLTLSDGYWDKDGLLFDQAKLFNDKYPGPLIEACWGDLVIVNVTNKLKHNGTSVHWHGLRQLRNMQADGVNGVTQCPIAPQDSFEYSFNVTQYGSSWYHSHYSVQYADGAAGPITLHGPSSDAYDDAIPALIMTDWGHNSAFDAIPNGLRDPDILLNGRGNITKYDLSRINETTIEPPYSMTFEPAQKDEPIKRYLIRIINTSFETTFIFSIDNHILEVISADFVPVVPYRNTTVLVGIGQRYDLIVEARPQKDPKNPLVYPPSDGNFWIRTSISNCNSDRVPPNSPVYDEVGILRYNASSQNNPTSKKWQGFSDDCSDETYTSLHPILPWNVGPPSNGLQVFHIGFDSEKIVPNFPLAKARLYNQMGEPSIRMNYTNITFLNLADQGTWNQSWRIVSEPKLQAVGDQWVYLVITGSGHPIHLHGHDFAILNQSTGPFDGSGFACGQNLNCQNPPRRDVVLIPEGGDGGYVVIAFKVDNPGMQILEDQENAAAIWPPGNAAVIEAQRVCNNWTTWYGNQTNWAPQNCSAIDQQFGHEYCFQSDSGV